MMTIEEIEDLLRKEIEWAIRLGPGFNQDYGAHFSGGKWSPRGCGTCAIGALVCHQQPQLQPQESRWRTQDPTSYPEVVAAAAIFLRSYEWTRELYFAVSSPNGIEDVEIRDLGTRLREFGRQIYEEESGPR